MALLQHVHLVYYSTWQGLLENGFGETKFTFVYKINSVSDKIQLDKVNFCQTKITSLDKITFGGESY